MHINEYKNKFYFNKEKFDLEFDIDRYIYLSMSSIPEDIEKYNRTRVSTYKFAPYSFCVTYLGVDYVISIQYGIYSLLCTVYISNSNEHKDLRVIIPEHKIDKNNTNAIRDLFMRAIQM